jgi:phosphopantothenoylcysteine decarboxylase/phosphopantothenate--cysteine ligase
MGLALAAEAARRGAEVTVVAANVALPAPDGIRVVSVQTAAELSAVCKTEFPAADVLLMAAAVADFRPVDPAATKLKKSEGTPRIELEPTEDILSALAGRRRAGQIVVGFAAEHGDRALAYGQGKLERKGLDAIVINDISRPEIGFDAPDNEVMILVAGGRERHVARAGKEQVAAVVLDEVEPLLTGAGPQPGKEKDDRTVRADPARITGV